MRFSRYRLVLFRKKFEPDAVVLHDDAKLVQAGHDEIGEEVCCVMSSFDADGGTAGRARGLEAGPCVLDDKAVGQLVPEAGGISGLDPGKWTPYKRECPLWQDHVGTSPLSTKTRP